MFQPPARLLGYQQITDLSAAVGLTIPDGANGAMIVAEAQAVRYEFTADPTTTVGMPLAKDQPPLYLTSGIDTVKFIGQAAGAKLNVTYFAADFKY